MPPVTHRTTVFPCKTHGCLAGPPPECHRRSESRRQTVQAAALVRILIPCPRHPSRVGVLLVLIQIKICVHINHSGCNGIVLEWQSPCGRTVNDLAGCDLVERQLNQPCPAAARPAFLCLIGNIAGAALPGLPADSGLPTRFISSCIEGFSIIISSPYLPDIVLFYESFCLYDVAYRRLLRFHAVRLPHAPPCRLRRRNRIYPAARVRPSRRFRRFCTLASSSVPRPRRRLASSSNDGGA